MDDSTNDYLEIYAEIHLRVSTLEGLGKFGADWRPSEHTGNVGLFLNEESPIARGLEMKGLTAARYEFLCTTCCLFRINRGRVSMKMVRYSTVRALGSLDAATTDSGIMAWADIFSRLAQRWELTSASFNKLLTTRAGKWLKILCKGGRKGFLLGSRGLD